MNRFKIYHALPEDAAFIRKTVFVDEQGFTDEFDDIDAAAKHIVLYSDEKQPIATCRFFEDRKHNAYIVGRIAVLKEFRKSRCGTALLQEAERQVRSIGVKKLMLAAQVQAKGFYERLGYSIVGEEFLEEHCPHIWMHKNL